jgi:Domain of unknown function (DUF222)
MTVRPCRHDGGMDETMAGWSGEPVADATRARRRARARELTVVRDALAANAWAGRGFRSPSAWLSAATGEPEGACKRMVFLSERLDHMPETSRAFTNGLLSEQAVGLLADAWSDTIADTFTTDEPMLVDWAMRLPYADARTVIETWVAHVDPARLERAEHDRFERRRLHISGLLDGMTAIDALLDTEGSAYLREALQFLARPADGETRTPAQRRADALVTMARFVTDHHDLPVGTKRRRPRVVVSVTTRELEQATGGRLDSAPISGAALRRMCCDAGLHRLITAGTSAIVDFGRHTRTISDSLFEALAERDGGCRWPGCTLTAHYCDAHHAQHWADLGETEPDNLLLLCWYHHHTVHEGTWSIEPAGAGEFLLTAYTGGRYEMRPPRLVLTAPP